MKTARLILFVLVFTILFFPRSLYAADSCTVNVSPSTVQTNTTIDFSFSITNTGSGTINSIKITRPSSNFSLSNPGVDGWSVSGNESYTELTGGSITSSSNTTIQYRGVSGGSEASSANWTVETNSGGGYVACTGSLGTAISGITDVSAPEISNAQVTGIYSTQATVTWTTNENATSVVNYGITSDYGLQFSSSTLVTSHSALLTGLSANTTYYAQISSVDANGNSTFTDEFSFTSAASDAGVATTVTVNTTTTTTTTTTNTVTKVLKDELAPSIRFINKFENVYEEAPLVEVSSTDGSGIARIEYSIDGGDNWYPIDINDFLGDKQIIVKFIPNAFEDGDYSLIVRSVDTSGNKNSTKEVEFTIDRLPPRVGPMLTFVGPIILGSGLDGFTDLLIGIEYKFILSSAGGPNKIFFSCMDNSYDLTRNPDTGFWFTKIKFEKDGECVPRIFAEDGAGNKEEIDRGKLRINKIGKLENAFLTIYWFDSFSNKFVVWEGLSYGQENPINTHDLGGYGMVLPPGKYYLEAKSAGKRTSISNIIESSETVFINDDWELSPAWKFWQLREEKIISPKVMGSKLWKNTNFQLPSVTLGNLSTNDIKGRVSIIALTTSWYPLTNEYLKTLDILVKDKINVIPILMQERENIAKFLKRRGGYNLEIYSDQDGELLKDINSVNNYPTTWIVNKFGQVIKEKVGIVDLEEIIEQLNSID